jgi:hypothetical protein
MRRRARAPILSVMTGNARKARPTRWAAMVLLVLAPVCAEYVSAYDDSTGDPLRLLGGLLIFVPLYGCPALLIREAARRASLGWPGILLLAAAFGVVEAGMVDQSLFIENYRNIPSWRDGLEPTYIAPFGFGAYYAFVFLFGHVVWTMAAPIAIAEGLVPQRRHDAWIGHRGLVIAAVLNALASLVIRFGDPDANDSRASTAELAGCALVVTVLVTVAVAQRRRRAADATTARVPGALPTFAGATALVAAVQSVPGTWLGLGLALGITVVAAVAIAALSRSSRWSQRHVVAIAAGALTADAVLAFTYFPLIGDVPALHKYLHNAVMLVLVLGVGAAAAAHAGGDDAAPAQTGRSRRARSTGAAPTV